MSRKNGKDKKAEVHLPPLDVYHPISARPVKVCTKDDHAGKKKSCRTPWCLYGLGEHREGIWRPTPTMLLSLGQNLKMRESEGGRMNRPMGIRNFGATCYANVLFQV